MNFKKDFSEALQSGKQHPELLELVRRHQKQGLAAEEAYQIMQQIWRDLGLDKGAAEGDLQNNLEAVMEKIWYECPAAER